MNRSNLERAVQFAKCNQPRINRVFRRVIAAGVLACALSDGVADQVHAQYGGRQPTPPKRMSRPTVSPYLNLLNSGGAAPALDYYNFVRPQQQFRAAASQLNFNVANLENEMRSVEKPRRDTTTVPPVSTGHMSPTGHSVSFGNTQSYFPDSNAGR